VKNLCQCRTAGEHKAGEVTEPLRAKKPQLPAMYLAHGTIEAGKQLEAGRGNADKDFPPIGILAAAADEGALFKAIEKAGNIRIAADHAARDFAAQQALGCSTQDTQHVVLIRREVMVAKELIRAAGEQVDGPEKIDKNGFFRTNFGLGSGPVGGNGWAAGHTHKMVVATDKRQRIGK
jgi:hypothetical protein